VDLQISLFALAAHRLRRTAGLLAGRSRAFLRDESAESMVGFALSSSILFMFIFGLTTMCLAFYTYESLSEMAREGARYAVVHGSSCETSSGSSCEVTAAEVNSYVQGLGIPNVGGGTMTVNTTYPDGGEAPNADRVEVTVSYSFPWHIPFSGSQTVNMSSSSEMYILQ
jgi:Flp pilus assembly protein TadG